VWEEGQRERRGEGRGRGAEREIGRQTERQTESEIVKRKAETTKKSKKKRERKAETARASCTHTSPPPTPPAHLIHKPVQGVSLIGDMMVAILDVIPLPRFSRYSLRIFVIFSVHVMVLILGITPPPALPDNTLRVLETVAHAHVPPYKLGPRAVLFVLGEHVVQVMRHLPTDAVGHLRAHGPLFRV
jgi:hypothetical protein